MRSLYILVLILSPAVAGGFDLDESTYINRQLGIRLEAPDGWTLHRQTGYPSLLALLFNESCSISLAVGPDGTDSLRRFAQENRKGIERVGLRVTSLQKTNVSGRSMWRLDFAGRKGEVAARQLYFSNGKRPLILTLTAPSKLLNQHLFDLDRVVELLELARPTKSTMRPKETSSFPKRPPNDDGSVPPGPHPKQTRETTTRANKAGAQSRPAQSRPAKPPEGQPLKPQPTKPPKGQPLQMEGLEQDELP